MASQLGLLCQPDRAPNRLNFSNFLIGQSLIRGEPSGEWERSLERSDFAPAQVISKHQSAALRGLSEKQEREFAGMILYLTSDMKF